MRPRSDLSEVREFRLAIQAPGRTADEVMQVIDEALHEARLCGCGEEGTFFVLAEERPDSEDE